jgi:hypothetical protein
VRTHPFAVRDPDALDVALGVGEDDLRRAGARSAKRIQGKFVLRQHAGELVAQTPVRREHGGVQRRQGVATVARGVE